MPVVIHTVYLVRCLVVSVWLSILRCANLWLMLWTRISRIQAHWTWLYGSVVGVVDCRSAGPWFNSGWRSVYVMTWSSNQIIQMINVMSPITTSIRTITRNSAKMVAELRTWHGSMDPRHGWSEGLLCSRQELHGGCSGPSLVDCPFAVMSWMQAVRSDVATRLKQVRRVPERPSGESPDILGKPTLRLTLQIRGQHIGMDKYSSNVGTADASVRHGCHVHYRTDGLKNIAKRVALAKLGTAQDNGCSGVVVHLPQRSSNRRHPHSDSVPHQKERKAVVAHSSHRLHMEFPPIVEVVGEVEELVLAVHSAG